MKEVKFLKSKIPLNNFISGIIGILAGSYFLLSLQTEISSVDVLIRTVLFFGPFLYGLIRTMHSEDGEKRFLFETLIYYFLGALAFLAVLFIEFILALLVVAYLGIELVAMFVNKFPQILFPIISTILVYALFQISLNYWDRTQAKKIFAKKMIRRLSEEEFIKTELKKKGVKNGK